MTDPDPDPAGSGVAAFDFDGTLTRRDTLFPFLARFRGRGRFAAALAAGARAKGRDDGKAVLLDRLVRGLPEAALLDAAADYAVRLSRRLRGPTVDHLRRHQEAGHRTVIVSGSLHAYLEPTAAHLEVDGVIGVELEAVDGLLTGAMARPNVRGAEKVRRLREHLEGGWGTLWAYGNARGDSALLAAADHPTWIGYRARVTGADRST